MPATKKRRPSASPAAISGQLREIIAARGLTAYSVAQSAELSPSVVSRFLSRERGLTLETFDAIAGALGLRLMETGRGRGRPSNPTRPAASRAEGGEGEGVGVANDPGPGATAIALESHPEQDRVQEPEAGSRGAQRAWVQGDQGEGDADVAAEVAETERDDEPFDPWSIVPGNQLRPVEEEDGADHDARADETGESVTASTYS